MELREVQEIRERLQDGYPFGGEDEDIVKLLEYIDKLENMPLVKTVIELKNAVKQAIIQLDLNTEETAWAAQQTLSRALKDVTSNE